MIRSVVLVTVVSAFAAAAHAQPVTSPSEVSGPPTAKPVPPAAKPVPPPPVATATPTGKQPPVAAALPQVGSELSVGGTQAWPKLDWMYAAPSNTDAAGKIAIHWFCAAKPTTCSDDLARLVTLRDTGRVYIVAYINGTKPQAKKLDPIRDNEGVGKGTVAFGRGVAKLVKQLGVGQASVVVDVDNKVQLVTQGGAPNDLDARDAKINALIGSIKEYVATAEAPKSVKAGDKLTLALKVQLAGWLAFSDKVPRELKIIAPADIKCESTLIKAEQIKIAERELTASVACTGAKGSYEVRGELRFGYDVPGTSSAAIGAETASWKFTVN